jgi:hypothetical protein
VRTQRLPRLISIAVLVAALAAELIGRLIGLGSPILYERDQVMEYYLKPNQSGTRFGRAFFVNELGMRSPPLPGPKGTNLLVFGDSVVNGGSPTDQAQLATSILATQLRTRNADPRLYVGNVSAGSWGPGNWLGFVKRFGFLEAKITLIVMSSHDIWDNPWQHPFDEVDHPLNNYPLALAELYDRHISRLAFRRPTPPSTAATVDRINQGSADLRAFIGLAKNSGSRVAVFHHPESAELSNGMRGELDYLKALCESESIPFVLLSQHYKARGGQRLYRDNIHLNEHGQNALADAIARELERLGWLTP